MVSISLSIKLMSSYCLCDCFVYNFSKHLQCLRHFKEVIWFYYYYYVENATRKGNEHRWCFGWIGERRQISVNQFCTDRNCYSILCNYLFNVCFCSWWIELSVNYFVIVLNHNLFLTRFNFYLEGSSIIILLNE